jgi:hypothetical protein
MEFSALLEAVARGGLLEKIRIIGVRARCD